MAQEIKAKGSGTKLKIVFNTQLECLGDYIKDVQLEIAPI